MTKSQHPLTKDKEALFDAVRRGEINKVKELLEKGHININAQRDDIDRDTPLVIAVEFDHLDIMQLLLDNGAVPSDHALYITIKWAKPESAKLLFIYGANPNLKDRAGEKLSIFTITRRAISDELEDLLRKFRDFRSLTEKKIDKAKIIDISSNDNQFVMTIETAGGLERLNLPNDKDFVIRDKNNTEIFVERLVKDLPDEQIRILKSNLNSIKEIFKEIKVPVFQYINLFSDYLNEEHLSLQMLAARTIGKHMREGRETSKLPLPPRVRKIIDKVRPSSSPSKSSNTPGTSR